MIDAVADIFQRVLLFVCVAGLVGIAVAFACRLVGHAWGVVRHDLPPMGLCVFGVLATVAVFYGGSKGTVRVEDPYIIDDGSYLTNDFVHVAIKKRVAILPDTTEILVYYRHEDSTNAADWVEFVPRLTFADFPHDFPLPGATNYNVIVGASYAPEPSVHTNGVWIVKGFMIPDAGGRAAFVNTRVHIFGTNDVVTTEGDTK